MTAAAPALPALLPASVTASSLPAIGFPRPWIVIALVAAAFGAGYLDAVVGGGGLVQLPALLLLLPAAAPIQILATNKLSSIFGTSVSASTYARRVRPEPATAIPLAGLALVGAVGGAFSASLVPIDVFRQVVLLVLVVVGLVVWLRPEIGAQASRRFHGHRHLVAAGVSGLAIGWYDGVLGPGTGTFFVFALIGLIGLDFVQASGTAKLANVATNVGALSVFVPQGAALWRIGLTMAAFNVAGGYLGARTALAFGVRFVRVVFLVVVSAVALRLGFQIVAEH